MSYLTCEDCRDVHIQTLVVTTFLVSCPFPATLLMSYHSSISPSKYHVPGWDQIHSYSILHKLLPVPGSWENTHLVRFWIYTRNVQMCTVFSMDNIEGCTYSFKAYTQYFTTFTRVRVWQLSFFNSTHLCKKFSICKSKHLWKYFGCFCEEIRPRIEHVSLSTHPNGSSIWTPISSIPNSNAAISASAGTVAQPSVFHKPNGRNVSQISKNLAVCLNCKEKTLSASAWKLVNTHLEATAQRTARLYLVYDSGTGVERILSHPPRISSKVVRFWCIWSLSICVVSEVCTIVDSIWRQNRGAWGDFIWTQCHHIDCSKIE